jgi:predicted permease
MNWLRPIAFRVRGILGKRQRDSMLDEELQTHLALLVEQNIQRGMSLETARREAKLSLGGTDQIKESVQDHRGLPRLDGLTQDLRYAFRILRKSPGFTAVAVLTLALGIGANTAIFSLLNAILLRELPVKNPSQLVLLGTGRGSGETGGIDTVLYSYRFFEEFERRNQVFSEASAMLSVLFGGMHGRVDRSASLEPINVQLVSGTYFSMLGVQPVLGQAFTRADDEPLGGHAVAMISHSWWARRLGSNPAVLGKTIAIGPTAYTIIGVTPQGFFGTTVGQSADVWIPLSMEKQVSPGWNGLEDKWWDSLYILGRLKRGVSAAQAQAGVNVLAKAIWSDFAGPGISPDRKQDLDRAWIDLTAAARGRSPLRFQYSLPLQVLMIVVGLLLLIACANIANLLLARSANREREMTLRVAVGASPARLFRQLLTESVLLACFGGALGILFASWASQALLAWVSAASEPLPLDVAPDARVLAFTFFVSLATALFFGTLPALRAARVELIGALKAGRGGASLGARSRLTRVLVVSQIALSFVLLIGAGLFLRTLVNLTRVNTGFKEKNVLLFGIDPPDVGYKVDSRLDNLYQQIEQKVAAQPGVRAASVSLSTFNQGEWRTAISVPGAEPETEDNPHVLHNAVGKGYFATMGIPLLVGRTFGSQDTAISPKVAVINETMARLYFPGGSPIGHHFRVDDDLPQGADFEVIGVVKDAKYISLDETPQPAAYYLYSQVLRQFYYDFEVRYSGDSRAIMAEVRSAVASVDPSLPLVYQSTLAENVDRSVSSQSLVARLSAFFGLVAVFLASIGIYGLMSFGVARRTNEIGIRMALGAPRASVFRMVLCEGLLLAGMGLVLGAALSLAAGRLVSDMLFGLAPADPMTMVVVAALLLSLAVLAGCLPARRAMRVDPMVALRYE